MYTEEQEEYLKRAKKIEEQVERWDLFAKIAPTFFLAFCFLLMVLGIFDFDTIFYIGLGLFAFTAVVWWFWTIFSIRFLVRLLRKASTNLVEVSKDLSEVKKELVDEIKHQENIRR